MKRGSEVSFTRAEAQALAGEIASALPTGCRVHNWLDYGFRVEVTDERVEGRLRVIVACQPHVMDWGREGIWRTKDEVFEKLNEWPHG